MPQYRIAAWLHDCGKITTPEHIVDKGSKLETIYNRVHEIRMRFEVLWRDAQLSYLETLKEHPEQQGELAAKLQRDHAQLQEEFAFIAECNVGGEFLDEDKQARLKAIAQRTWIRHFDNRIGLSPVEELRVEGVARVPTPASEKLLADKPEHIIERTRSTDYPPEYGINMDVPEHLYNQGELYNLGISRGTLTAEERFKINEHIISNIKMLESLPFPEEIANAPTGRAGHPPTMKPCVVRDTRANYPARHSACLSELWLSQMYLKHSQPPTGPTRKLNPSVWHWIFSARWWTTNTLIETASNSS